VINYLIIHDAPDNMLPILLDKLREDIGWELKDGAYELYKIPSVLALSHKLFLKYFIGPLNKKTALAGINNIAVLHFYNTFDVLKNYDTKRKNPIEKIQKDVKKSLNAIKASIQNSKNNVIVGYFQLGETFKETEIVDLYEVPFHYEFL